MDNYIKFYNEKRLQKNLKFLSTLEFLNQALVSEFDYFHCPIVSGILKIY
ncbi:IS3 family transposase (plasmid) [Paraclostridium sordellii]|nr:IS3 family transposase [Paeniclostridium sordellii]